MTKIGGVCLLAGGCLRAVVHVNEGLSGLLRGAGLLGGNGNAAVLGGLHTNGLECWKFKSSILCLNDVRRQLVDR